MQEPIYIINGVVVEANITQTVDAMLTDRLDGTLMLAFTTKAKYLPEITTGTKIQYKNKYFVASQIQYSTSGGEFLVYVSCEHESISLVDQEIEEFNFTGGAHDALDRLLSGTEYFGLVDFYAEITISASNTNRRAVLLEIAKLCGGEIVYEGREIQIRRRRGNTEPIDIVQACKCTDVSTSFDLRNGTEGYELTGTCADGYNVGDEVILDFKPLGIYAQKRIVGISYNPFNCTTVSLEVGDYTTDITDDYAKLEKIFLMKADAKIEFEKYINSAEGKAGLKATLEGDFVVKNPEDEVVTLSTLKTEVENYIDGEEGTAIIRENLSGEFVTFAEYNKSVHLMASPGQTFVKKAGETAYTPSAIILTAQTAGEGMTFAWYRGETLLSANGRSLTVTAEEFTASAGYRVVATDAQGKTYSDMITIAKLADGQPGKNGADGQPGKNGDDGYTVILSNEFIEIPVDTERKPISNKSYSCTISVYKGLTMIPGNSIDVSVQSIPEGVNATVSGTAVSVAVNKETAIADSGTVDLHITVDQMTLKEKITIRANTNQITIDTVNVTATIQKAVEDTKAEITLSTDYKKNTIGTNVQALLQLVSNPNSSEIKIKADKINFEGFTTFVRGSDLGPNGSTSIDAGRITTGQISAERIDTSTLRAQQVYYYDPDVENYFSVMSASVSGQSTVTRVGPKDIRNGYLQALELYGTSIYMAYPGDIAGTDYAALMFDMTRAELIPSVTQVWNLGAATNAFDKLYIGEIYFFDASKEEWKRMRIKDGILELK